jgi:hypothetical protein
MIPAENDPSNGFSQFRVIQPICLVLRVALTNFGFT